MLGAVLASVRIHLSPELAQRQAALRERIDLCTDLIREFDLPLANDTPAPIGCPVPGTIVCSAPVNRRVRVPCGTGTTTGNLRWEQDLGADWEQHYAPNGPKPAQTDPC
jgi:hypothetical protein